MMWRQEWTNNNPPPLIIIRTTQVRTLKTQLSMPQFFFNTTPPTLSVGGAADHVGEFGFEAGGGRARLPETFKAARSERDHTLQGRVGPQALALVDGQCCGVVDEQTSILGTKQKRYHVTDSINRPTRWSLCQDRSRRDQLTGIWNPKSFHAFQQSIDDVFEEPLTK